MRGTKYFCIIVGLILVIGSTFPAPFPLVVQNASWERSTALVERWIREGVLTVDAGKLANDPGYKDQPPGATDSPEQYIPHQIMRETGMSTHRAVRPYWIGMIVVGLLWIGVGIRTPSRLPTAPPGTPPT